MAPVTQLVALAALALCAGAVRDVPSWKMGKDVLAKFNDLGKQSKNITKRWHQKDLPPIPAHIKKQQAQVLDVVPIARMGGCGTQLLAKNLGLKKSKAAASMWRTSLLETKTQLRGPEHPGRESFSVPGAGGTQTIKDEGRSVMGHLKDGRKTVEPYVTVMKDGFWEVGCFQDSMKTFGDKFGNDADKYRMQSSDVSIALYDELVLDEKKEPMTPTVCFEFCRTLPDMVFFGIADGRTCYCTPYYKPMPGDDEGCNAGCAGDPTTMCGNMKGKSSIFEMHLCESTLTDLTEAMSSSKEALDYFFEVSMLADDLGKKMTASGLALEKVGGLSGAPGAGDNGMTAKQSSKDLTQGFMDANDSYEKLLAAYKSGKDQESSDFTVSANAVAAEHATATMGATVGAVVNGAAATHATLKLAFPAVDQVVFGDEPDGGDAAAMGLKGLVDGDEQAEADFRVASYPFDNGYEPKQSSCKGPVIGLPMVGLGQSGCALACEATVYPKKCVAYSFYTLTGADDLCFMLEDVDVVETFTCPAPAFIQKAPKSSVKADTESASAFCGIKMSELTTGYKPKGDWKKTKRCFGKDAGIALKQGFTSYSVPGGNQLTSGAVTLDQA